MEQSGIWNMAGAALDSFEAANPCDMVLWLLFPAGHNINLSLALLQKVADCKLECRAIQVFWCTCSAHFVRHHKGLWQAVLQTPKLSRPWCGRGDEDEAWWGRRRGRGSSKSIRIRLREQVVTSKVSPSDCPRGTNQNPQGYLLNCKNSDVLCVLMQSSPTRATPRRKKNSVLSNLMKPQLSTTKHKTLTIW